MKFVLISPKNRTIYNFRGDLVREIIRKGYEVIATGPNEDGLEKIQELGVRFVTIPLEKNGLSVLSDLRYAFALYKLLKKEKPNKTLGYTIKPVIFGALAAKLARVPQVYSMVTGSGYAFTATTAKAGVIRKVVCVLYKIGFLCADKVIFQNADDRDFFVERRLLKKEKCYLVNGSGVNMQKYPRVPLPKKLCFFMLSRVMISKGVLEYLSAADKVKKKYPDARFMLLGAVENIQDSLSEDTLKQYTDNGTIEYFGETDDVVSFYKQCSVYVLPSYSEGTPRTVLEAMAMGRPIITTDAPGCRETVLDGKSGFLVPVKDVDALAEKMEWFLLHPEEIQTMGNRSYDYCKEKFDVLRVNRDMLSHLDIDE